MSGEYYYEYEWDIKYCYPNSYVLKNKLNIKDQAELESAERAIRLKLIRRVSKGLKAVLILSI